MDGDLYMFDEFQTGTCELRRPKMESLYDVFVAIRDDELAHAKTSECSFAKLTSFLTIGGCFYREWCRSMRRRGRRRAEEEKSTVPGEVKKERGVRKI